MSYIRQDIELGSPSPKSGDWFGVFAKTVTDITHLAKVIIPEWDEKFEWGPCRWMARDSVSLPQKGDDCLVRFDNRNQLWVVAWWPF